MDARPHQEQRELQEAADRLARKLGPSAVGDLDDADRRDRLDAALVQAGLARAAHRHARAGRLGGRGGPRRPRPRPRTCDAAFLGPVLADDLLRRAGARRTRITRAIAVSADLARLAGRR